MQCVVAVASWGHRGRPGAQGKIKGVHLDACYERCVLDLLPILFLFGTDRLVGVNAIDGYIVWRRRICLAFFPASANTFFLNL